MAFASREAKTAQIPPKSVRNAWRAMLSLPCVIERIIRLLECVSNLFRRDLRMVLRNFIHEQLQARLRFRRQSERCAAFFVRVIGDERVPKIECDGLNHRILLPQKHTEFHRNLY